MIQAEKENVPKKLVAQIKVHKSSWVDQKEDARNDYAKQIAAEILHKLETAKLTVTVPAWVIQLKQKVEDKIAELRKQSPVPSDLPDRLTVDTAGDASFETGKNRLCLEWQMSAVVLGDDEPVDVRPGSLDDNMFDAHRHVFVRTGGCALIGVEDQVARFQHRFRMQAVDDNKECRDGEARQYRSGEIGKRPLSLFTLRFRIS